MNEIYERWLARVDDAELREELLSIRGDEAAIRDRFYCELSFGTAGLRGVLGAGSNRMNLYNVRRATAGLAQYLCAKYERPAVGIAYDSRHKSDVFAREAAAVLAAAGVKVHLFRELTPTPVLSFTVRHLALSAGIVITASHNPAAYNGYKVYGEDGAQLGPAAAEEVTAAIRGIDLFDGVNPGDFEAALAAGEIVYLGEELMEAYYKAVLSQSVLPEVVRKSGLSVVYTPLNGAGNKPVREIFSRIGVERVAVVPEQEKPDGDFPTCPYPNPETREALALALKLAEREKPDVVIATDPDSDRVGIAVGTGEGLKLLTGNEVGVLLLDYIVRGKRERGALPERPVAVSTVVSTTLTGELMKKYGGETRYVLTGFKFIGGELEKLVEEGCPERFMLGFEESYGYLVGTYCRDKDAVVASMLICEMAAYYKGRGLSLYDAMEAIYREFGYYQNDVKSFAFAGESGMHKMAAIMERLRTNPPREIAGHAVEAVSDVQKGERRTRGGAVEKLGLPASNVLIFELAGGFRAIARPSGTEPKLKCYLTAVGGTRAEAERESAELLAAMSALIEAE